MAENRLIAVVGAGSWGTALAIHLAKSGYPVQLWARDSVLVAQMAELRHNTRYLPEIELPAQLIPTAELLTAVATADVVVIATPSGAFTSMVDQLKPLVSKDTLLIWACKGFSGNRLLSDVAYSRLGDGYSLAVLSGPNFSGELARGLPIATTIAASNLPIALRASEFFHHGSFRAYASEDMTGVQLAGALKNIYAIATGISDGIGLGANARAALITRGMAEMQRLATKMGAKQETLMGLSGIGDLLLTCTDDQSRNRRFGLAIGRGQSAAAAIDEIGQVVEGAKAVDQALALSEQYGIELPIASQVSAVISGTNTARTAVEQLLSRAPRTE